MGEKTDVRIEKSPFAWLVSELNAVLRAGTTGPVCAGALTALVLAAGCHSPYESGLSDYAEGRHAEAEDHVEQGLDEDPGDPQLNLLMAQILAAGDDYRRAEPYATRAFDSGEQIAEAGRTLGKIHWELGHPVDAAKAWKAARQADPDSVGDTDYRRALEAAIANTMNLQRFELALELRAELAEIDPDHAEAGEEAFRINREGLANALEREGQYEEAVEVFAQLTEDFPDRPRYALSSGRLMVQLDRHDEAIDVFTRYVEAAQSADRVARNLEIARRAERLDAPEVAIHFHERGLEAMAGQPSFRRAKLNLTLAGMRFDQGDEEKGREHIDQYLNDMTELRGLPLEAEVYMTAADVAQAHQQQAYGLELLESGLKHAPPSWNLAEKLASRYARRARTAQMERILKTYLEREDDAHDAQLRVARWALNRRNHDLAQHFFERAVEHDEAGAGTWLELARVYSSVGQVDKLQHALETYVKRFDQDRYELLEVASMYQSHRLYEESEAVLEQAHKDDPKSLAVIDRMAELYTEWGKPSKLHDRYRRWLKARGSEAADYQLVGERFVRRGQSTEALPYLQTAAESGSHHAWLQIADIYSRQRRHRAMKEALANYRQQAPESGATYRSLLSRYRSADMTHEAIKTLESLIELEPQVLSNYQQLSDLYFSQGREREAIRLWTDYLDNSSRPMDTLESIAHRFDRRGQPQAILSLYHHLLERDDADPRLYRLIGDTYLAIASRRQRYRGSGQLPQGGDDPRDKARHYYDKYLEAASPSRTELLDFADSMRSQRMWDVASGIYQRLARGEADGSQIWFNYARVLLQMGEVDRAEELLERYHTERGEKVGDARSIAQALFEVQRYSAAEPYFRQMFESDQLTYSSIAFRSLAQIYRATEQPEKISRLITEHLDNAQNPANARQEILAELANAGMYEEAADQIERIRAFQGEVSGRQLAVNRYRAGQDKQAWEAFSQWADQHAYPGDAWEEVGNFYLSAAEADRARTAYENGIEVEPKNARLHVAHGRMQLLQGEVQAGLDALERAREALGDGQQMELIQLEIHTLMDIGRLDLARDAAERAADKAGPHQRDRLLRIVARYDLATQQPARVKRTVNEIVQSNLSLPERVELLVDADFREEAAKLIEDQLASGDPYSASQVLIEHADLLTSLGGFERLERALQPLLDEPGNGMRVRAQLGEYLVSQGEYQRGIPHLRWAVGQGYTSFLPSLAHAYASLGYHDQALRVLQQQLESAQGPNFAGRLEQVGAHFEMRGERTQFVRLLRVLMSDERYRRYAAPLLAEFLAEEGRLEESIDVLYESSDSVQHPQSPDEAGVVAMEDNGVETTAGVLEALAGEGYVEEARGLLSRLDDDMKSSRRIRDLELRLAAAVRPEEAAELARERVADLGTSEEDNNRRLEVAEMLHQRGAYKLADEIAAPGLSNPARSVGAQAASFLLRNAFTADDTGRLEEVVTRHLEQSDDKVATRGRLADHFRQLGLDARASRTAGEVSRAVPVPEHIREANEMARTAGDADALGESLELYLRVSEQPVDELAQTTDQIAGQQEYELTELMLEPLMRVRPAAWQTRFLEIETNFRRGRVERGREQLVELLDFVEWDSYAIERVLDRLNRAGLYVEGGRFLAEKLEERPLTRRSHLHLGIALRELGFEEQAREHFDAFVDASSDSALAATIIAGEMTDREQLDTARHYADLSLQERPESPEPRYYRGLARLRAGDVEGAQRDLEESVGPGMNRQVALQKAAVHALKAGEDDAADELLDELLATASPLDPSFPVQLAIYSFTQAERGERGIRYFEERFPDITNGDGVLGRRLVQHVAQLYETGGDHPRAYETYEKAIDDLLVRDGSTDTLVTYMNNLAYTFSTTDRHIERGLDLVRRAIAATPSRSPSYLDTLGWLYYRQGDIEEAAALVNGALRTSAARGGLGELVEHLAVLRRLQGRHSEANWLEIQLHSLQ
ncbi:MAG: tetratricopeptide repeat protein [Persicimonas sp.]